MQTVSISYLRCIIEHVRCHLLDRDIELIYYTIRKSSDVITRDPMQLGAQVSYREEGKNPKEETIQQFSYILYFVFFVFSFYTQYSKFSSKNLRMKLCWTVDFVVVSD